MRQWSDAWTGNRPADLAALFTADGEYEDLAFQATWRGPEQIAGWVAITHRGIADAAVTVADSFRSGDHIAITWTFSGQMRGAPHPFSVPATTIMQLCDGKIVKNRDLYNLAALLKQSGLPADWTPPGA